MEKPSPSEVTLSHFKAIIFIISAYFCLAVMGIFVKLASPTIPTSEILFARFLLGMLFIFPFTLKNKQLRLNLRKIHFFILRNLAGISSMLLNFYAIKHLPVSIAILLINTSALFVPLILRCFGVKTSIRQLVLIGIGFLGVCVILLGSEQQEQIDNFYVAIGLGSSILAAMAYCSLQELNKYNSAQSIVFYFHLIGVLVLWGMFQNDWISLDQQRVLYLLGVGIFGLFFQILLTKAFRYAPANQVTPFTFVGVIFSSIFDGLFLQINLSLYFWIGTLIIVFAISALAKKH